MNDGSQGLSGVRLVRARPSALIGTFLLTAALAVSYNWAWLYLIPGYGPLPSGDPGEVLTRWLVLPLVRVLPEVVPLVVVAALAKRRVTVDRVLLLWAAAGLLVSMKNALFMVVSFADPLSAGGGWAGYASTAAGIAVLIAIGLLGRWLLPLPGFPVVRGGRELSVLVLASVLAVLASGPWGFGLGLWGAGVVWALLTVGWAVAALVTSAPEVSAWSGDPAELGRQDP